MRNFFKAYFRFLIPVFIIIGLMIIGTIGYILIDNYTAFNAFYMTVITLATVGYGEVQPLSDEGKMFTAFLVITSFATFAYAITSVTKFVVDGELNQVFKNRKLKSSIEKLKDHVIICGYGRNGRQAVEVLKTHNRDFVVIEQDSALVTKLNSHLSDLIISGDATQDDILIRAGVYKAKALITTLPTDSANVFIVLTARNMNPDITIISRASDDNSDTKLKIAGANNVIMPDKVGGAQMASLVTKPDVMEFLDFITTHTEMGVNLEEIYFNELAEEWENKTLNDIAERNKGGANIIGFKSSAGLYTMNPSPETQLEPKAKLFVLGDAKQIKQIKQLLKV